MKKFKKFLLILTAGLMFQPTTYAKKKHRQAKSVHTTAVKKTGKFPLPLLKVSDLAKLEYFKRVQYLTELRRAWKDVEKFQRVHDYKYFSKNDFVESPALWAFLFGNSADAADEPVSIPKFTLTQMKHYDNWTRLADRKRQGNALSAAEKINFKTLTSLVQNQMSVQDKVVAGLRLTETERSQLQTYKEFKDLEREVITGAADSDQSTGFQRKKARYNSMGREIGEMLSSRDQQIFFQMQNGTYNSQQRGAQSDQGSQVAPIRAAVSEPKGTPTNDVARNQLASNATKRERRLQIKRTPDKTSNEIHRRGGLPSDQCVYGANLQKYQSHRNQFGCSAPKCVGKNGKAQDGIGCGFMATGLTGSNACVSPGSRLDSTAACFARVDQLMKKDERAGNTEKKKLLGDLLAYTTGKKPWPKGKGPFDPRWVKELEKYAYDPMAMAFIIQFADQYKLNNRGRDFPLKNFTKNWNKNVTGLNTAYGDFIRHCEKKLDLDIWKDITNYKSITSLANRATEKIRYENGQKSLKKFIDDGGNEEDWRPTVGDTLQKNQCDRILKQKDRTETALNSIVNSGFKDFDTSSGEAVSRSTSPSDHNTVRTDRVKRETPSRGRISQPQAQEETLILENDITSHSGCHPEQYTRTMLSKALSCVHCSEQARSRYSHGLKANEYISPKWLAFLGVMAHACNKTSGELHVAQVLEMVQTYGHCKASDYNWKSGRGGKSDYSAKIQNRIAKWQKGEGFDTIDDGSFYGKKGSFINVFGLRFSTSKKMFCPKESKGPQTAESRYKRRKHALQKRNDWSNQFSSNDGNKLKDCITKANKQAQLNFSGYPASGGMCRKTITRDNNGKGININAKGRVEPTIIELEPIGSAKDYKCLVATKSDGILNTSGIGDRHSHPEVVFSDMKDSGRTEIKYSPGKKRFLPIPSGYKQSMTITVDDHLGAQCASKEKPYNGSSGSHSGGSQ